MLIKIFWLINFAILALTFYAIRLPTINARFSFAVLQALLFLPLLVAEDLLVTFSYLPVSSGFHLFFVSQSLFLIIWGFAAGGLRDTLSQESSSGSGGSKLRYFFLVVLVLLVVGYQTLRPDFIVKQNGVQILPFQGLYIASLLSLLVMLLMAWQLEAFWRQLPKNRSRDYGLFLVGGLFVCVVQGGVASFLVTYLELSNEIFLLQGGFLLVAWILLVVAVLRYRLLRRNFFVSRKIVYSIVAPSFFAIYFLFLGTISLVVRLYDFPLKLVLFWFVVGVGAVGAAILFVSESVRQRFRFFVSTHFYVDKYEYRDEWLAFSVLLQNANSEAKVLGTLHQVLVDTLYTKDIWIWAGNEADGYNLVVSSTNANKQACHFAGDGPVISYLRQKPYLDLTAPANRKNEMFQACSVSMPPPWPILFVPLVADGQILGCIGVGPEYTGGRYGQDDFDLLTALGSQAASALIAVRLSEEAARLRERRALHNVSAFLLHDIKNAASILSLVHANAVEHMDNPEFRKDMVTAVGDALQRMEKAQTSLAMLRDRVRSVWQDIVFCKFLSELLVRFEERLPGLEIRLECPSGLAVRTDPQLLETVIENLLLNAYEAGEGKCQVNIEVVQDEGGLTISVANNGPAIPEHLLPDQLFQRFVSDKPDGSGIGLWQARLVLQRLGATIMAENPDGGGARFVIRLPVVGSFFTDVG